MKGGRRRLVIVARPAEPRQLRRAEQRAEKAAQRRRIQDAIQQLDNDGDQGPTAA